MAVPTLDAPLTEYSTNFQARGSAAPGDFSLSVGQMAQYTVLHDNWMAAYNAAKPEGAKSRALVRAKNDMKAILLPFGDQAGSKSYQALFVSLVCALPSAFIT